jgi:hypothetical protein
MMWVLAQELNNETVSPGALGTLVVVCLGVDVGDALVHRADQEHQRDAQAEQQDDPR